MSCFAVEGANDEGEKVYYIRGRLFGSCVLQGPADVRGSTPTPGFCGIQRRLVQTSWKQTTVTSPLTLLMILSGR